MEMRKTNRGFDLIQFEDLYGVKCSLQKSSLATDDAVWLGCDDPNAKKLIPGQGWVPVNLPDEINLSTRMHLNRDQVKALLPHLQKFVEEGEI